MNVTGINAADSASGEPTRSAAQLRRLSGEIVGSVFYGTLLKTVRESPLKGSYGHGGRGEEVFSAQLHGILAERAGAARANGLADALYQRLLAQTERLHAGKSLPAQEASRG